MNSSEAADSDLYSSEDSSAEAQRFRFRHIVCNVHNNFDLRLCHCSLLRRLKRYKDKVKERERLRKIQERFKVEAPPITGTLALVANAVKKSVYKPIIEPVAKSVSKTVHRTHKSVRRSIRHIKEVSAMRTRKMFNTMNGTFDEIQRELKYEIYYQYIAHQVTLARDKARHEFSVIDTVRQNVQGTGKENAFRAWVKWVYTKKQRERRDIRRNWKAKTKGKHRDLPLLHCSYSNPCDVSLLSGFDAAMASVTSAQQQVDMWLKCYDIYTDRPYWQHNFNGEEALRNFYLALL